MTRITGQARRWCTVYDLNDEDDLPIRMLPLPDRYVYQTENIEWFSINMHTYICSWNTYLNGRDKQNVKKGNKHKNVRHYEKEHLTILRELIISFFCNIICSDLPWQVKYILPYCEGSNSALSLQILSVEVFWKAYERNRGNPNKARGQDGVEEWKKIHRLFSPWLRLIHVVSFHVFASVYLLVV